MPGADAGGAVRGGRRPPAAGAGRGRRAAAGAVAAAPAAPGPAWHAGVGAGAGGRGGGRWILGRRDQLLGRRAGVASRRCGKDTSARGSVRWAPAPPARRRAGVGSASGAALAITGASTSALRACTPRPTSTPHRKITTDTTVTAMNRKTSCLPLNWISRTPSSGVVMGIAPGAAAMVSRAPRRGRPGPAPPAPSPRRSAGSSTSARSAARPAPSRSRSRSSTSPRATCAAAVSLLQIAIFSASTASCSRPLRASARPSSRCARGS